MGIELRRGGLSIPCRFWQDRFGGHARGVRTMQWNEEYPHAKAPSRKEYNSILCGLAPLRENPLRSKQLWRRAPALLKQTW